jgi:RNA-directed DNA polymerase
MKGEPFVIKRLEIAHERSLARALSIPLDELKSLASESKDLYRPFEHLPAPKPFARNLSRKPRPIDNPQAPLKNLQQKINDKLLRPIVFPDHIFGAVRYRSILGNAHLHQGASLLVTLDIKQCFPSITNLHVYEVWKGVLGCSPPVAALLTRVTTFNRHLPQGAPTSPLLANLYIWSADREIRERCVELGVCYSTWVDDLAFSGSRAREIIQPAVEILARNGLRLSHKKIKIMGNRQTKALTGTRFGRQMVRAPKELCDRARAGIHKLQSGLVTHRETSQYCQKLAGLVRHIERICPKDAVQLQEQLRQRLKAISPL